MSAQTLESVTGLSVSVASLAVQLTGVAGDVAEIKQLLREQNGRLRDGENHIAVLQTEMAAVQACQKQDSLLSKLYAGLSALIGGAVAAAITFLKQ